MRDVPRRDRIVDRLNDVHRVRRGLLPGHERLRRVRCVRRRLLPAQEWLELVRARRERDLHIGHGASGGFNMRGRHVQRRRRQHLVLGLPGRHVERLRRQDVPDLRWRHLRRLGLGSLLRLQRGEVLCKQGLVVHRVRPRHFL